MKIYLSIVAIVVSPIVMGADPTFDCRRVGQECQNSGKCLPNGAGKCSACGNSATGDWCQITDGSNAACNGKTCNSHGTCDGGTCECNPGFTGTDCENSLYDVICKADDIVIGIQPFGTFSGTVFLEGKKTDCSFGDVSAITSTGDKKTHWNGKAKKMAYSDATCGPATSTTSPLKYTYKVVVQYNTYATDLDELVTVTCELTNSEFTSVVEVSNLQIDSTKFPAVAVDGKIQAISQAIKDKDGNPVTPSTQFNIGEKIEITLTLTPTSLAALSVTKCVASDAGTPEVTQEILTAGCPPKDARDVWLSYPSLVAASSGKAIKFELKAFKFPATNKLKLTFSLKACDSGSAAGCALTSCDGSKRRRRRDVGNTTEEVVEAIFTIRDPAQVSKISEDEKTNKQKECSVSKLMLGALVSMAAVVFVLLVVCGVFIYRAMKSRQSTSDSKEDLYRAPTCTIPRVINSKS